MITHVGLHRPGNAGDTLLFVASRLAIDNVLGAQDWTLLDAHRFGPEELARANAADLLLIGGGGLFLRDTNPNAASGWQWPCSLERLKRIRVPTAVFGVGYNRFRGQPEFLPVFARHVRALLDRSAFFGLRNRGSIARIERYLDPAAGKRPAFQPCPTTMLSHFLPIRAAGYEKRLALNLAFDRAPLRYGGEERAICGRIAQFARRAARAGWHVDLVTHCGADLRAAAYLETAGVQYRRVRLEYAPWHEIVRYYMSVPVTVGMRGHSQMIPCGCGNAFLSIVSHDKLAFFLEDVRLRYLGVEAAEEALADRLFELLPDKPTYAKLQRHVAGQKKCFWELTRENLATIAAKR